MTFATSDTSSSTAITNQAHTNSLRRWFDQPGWVLALYALLSLVMTFPLVLQFRTHVPAGTVDLWQNYWNFWWWKKCLIELHQSPYHTQYLFHPTGASMVFYTHSPLNMIVSLPVSLLFGYAAAYNFCVLAALTFSGWTMFLLVRELTEDSLGAFLAGLVFAFFPQHLEQTLEHLNLFSIQFMPLAVFFLLRLCRRGGIGNAVGLGVAYACNALVSWHLGILLSFVLIPVVIVELVRPRRSPALIGRDLAVAILVAGLLTLPAVWPLIRDLAGGGDYFQKPQTNKGIDPLFLFLPSDHHPIFGGLTRGIYAERQAYFTAGFLCYLGFTPLVLAVWGLLRRRPGAFTWVGVFLGTLIFALGTNLILAGRTLSQPTLPFAILDDLPLLRLMRIANRFLILSSLALAVLVGLGWSGLRVRSMGKFAVVAFLILFEYLWLPYPTQRIEHPAYYEQLASTEDAGAVLHIPFTSTPETVHNMLAQTAHNRPIAGGYLSTTPPEAEQFIENDPLLSRLSGLRPSPRQRIDANHLQELGFGTVILHKDPRGYLPSLPASADFGRRRREMGRPGLDYRELGRFMTAFERALGAPVYEDERIVVFEVRGDG